MEVLKYIPEGRENAISRPVLCSVTGLPDRAVRREIRRLRESGEMILSDTERSGYWLAGDDDFKEVLRCHRMLESYIKSLWILQDKYRQWLADHEPEK